MMIKIDEGCYVAADQIAEAKVDTYATGIHIRLKDGVTRYLTPGYGESAYTALDKLITEINAASATDAG